MSDNLSGKKPIYKKVWFLVLVIIILIIIASMSGGNNNTSDTQEVSSNKNETTEKNLSAGEMWTVDGQWSLTINSITNTEGRNEFSDKTPNQVVLIEYSYENLGYEDKNGIMDGLYFDLEPGIDTNIVDGNGEVAYSYPGNVTTHPQQTPVGAKCVNAQSCIGLNNKSDTITINIKKYDSNGKQQKAKYVLNVNQ